MDLLLFLDALKILGHGLDKPIAALAASGLDHSRVGPNSKIESLQSQVLPSATLPSAVYFIVPLITYVHGLLGKGLVDSCQGVYYLSVTDMRIWTPIYADRW